VHHPWSANGEVFNSKYLLNHLIQTVLPLAKKLEIPDDVPIHFQTPPDSVVLGTEPELTFQFKYRNENVIDDFKTSARSKRKCLEDEGKMDCWSSMQQNIMPTIDENFVGFKIEMLFEYENDDGTRYLNWCNGVFDSILNEKTRYVTVKGNKDSLGPNDSNTSREKLLMLKWNP
jgi:hypothetical protein